MASSWSRLGACTKVTGFFEVPQIERPVLYGGHSRDVCPVQSLRVGSAGSRGLTMTPDITGYNIPAALLLAVSKPQRIRQAEWVGKEGH